MLDPALDTNQVLYRLYHEDGVRVYRPRPLAFSCRCSRDKVAQTLAAFPAEELEDMHDEAGTITPTCEFCQADYVFTDAEHVPIEPRCAPRARPPDPCAQPRAASADVRVGSGAS